MLTSEAFGREHTLLGFDRLVLSGPDIPSGCFDLYPLPLLRMSSFSSGRRLLVPHWRQSGSRRQLPQGPFLITNLWSAMICRAFISRLVVFEKSHASDLQVRHTSV